MGHVYSLKKYACPEIFSILFEEINLIGGGTCRKKIIGLPENDERLKLKKLHREELTDGYKKGVSVLYPQY